MIRLIYLLTLLSIYSIGINAQIPIKGIDKTADTLMYRQIGPGITYSKVNLPDLPLDFYMFTVDLTDPYNKIETFQAQNTVKKTEAMSKAYNRLSTETKRTLGGVNANFWIVSGQGQDDLIGVPHSGSISDGVMITDPNKWNRGHGAIGFATIDADRKLCIDDMQFDGVVKLNSGETYSISEINRKRLTDELVFFNEYIGSSTNSDDNGIEVFIKPVDGQKWGTNVDVICQVTRIIKNKGANPLEKGESVLSGNGLAKDFLDKLSVGQMLNVNMGIKTLKDNLKPRITQMVTGNALVLKDGILTDRNYNEDYNSMLYPRTGIGMSQDGKTAYMIVIDKMGKSIGATTETMCEILKYAGAWNVTSMDGGGSAQMMLGGEIVNKPSGGVERAVANAWFLYSTAPTDQTVSRIEFADYNVTIPMYASYKPIFFAYNKYGELIDDNLQGVEISCDPSFGSISNDKTTFVSLSTSGRGTLMASYNGLKVEKNIIVENATIDFRLQSLIIDDVHPYSIEVISTVNGSTFLLDPSFLTWNIADVSVCKIEKGVLKGLTNGTTTITGTLGSFSKSIDVTVEISDQKYYVLEPFIDLSSFKRIKASSNLVNFITAPSAIGKDLKVSYTYTSSSYSSIEFEKTIETYSLPDTIILSINTGNIPFSKIGISLTQNNEFSKKFVYLESLEVGKDAQLKVVVSDILTNPMDISSYPIKINKIMFYPDDTKHTVGGEYHFFIKDISLAYAEKKAVGIDNEIIDKTSLWSVYPNPVKRGENINVRLFNAELLSDLQISIYSINGELVDFSNYANQDIISIPTSKLTTGTYLIRIQSDKGVSEVFKVIVK